MKRAYYAVLHRNAENVTLFGFCKRHEFVIIIYYTKRHHIKHIGIQIAMIQKYKAKQTKPKIIQKYMKMHQLYMVTVQKNELIAR